MHLFFLYEHINVPLAGIQVLALASLAQVLVRVQLAHCTDRNEKCDLYMYVIRMEQYSSFCQ